MSKLNRREFKELLTEWNNNFINEKYQSQLTKDAFQNIHSLNTSGEIFPELNIDIIEYDHSYGELPESVDELISDKNNNRDYERGGYIFSKTKDKSFIKNLLDAFISDGVIENKSYEEILNNNNGLIISPAGLDNEFESKNNDSMASKYENSNWMLHDVFHSLLKNQEWKSSDGLVDTQSLIEPFDIPDSDIDWDKSVGNIINDYFNDHFSHKNIDNYIRRSVNNTDHLFDIPMFIVYFTLHIENGMIDEEKSSLKLKEKLSRDFLSHPVLSQAQNKNDEKFFIKYMGEFQKYIIHILNQFNSNPRVFIKFED